MGDEDRARPGCLDRPADDVHDELAGLVREVLRDGAEPRDVPEPLGSEHEDDDVVWRFRLARSVDE
jgi:hypothetical protein